jgi:hypothetical protein
MNHALGIMKKYCVVSCMGNRSTPGIS